MTSQRPFLQGRDLAASSRHDGLDSGQAGLVGTDNAATFSNPQSCRSGAAEVAYDSADQAAKALTQFRASVTGCPKNAFVHSTVAGVPDLRYAGVLTNDPTLPVADNAVDTVTLTVKGSLKHQ